MTKKAPPKPKKKSKSPTPKNKALYARVKAEAKRKFDVYPSAYANAYASKICAGKIKDPSGKKKKDWGPKKMNCGGFVAKRYRVLQ